MEALPVSEQMVILSHRGQYSVELVNDFSPHIAGENVRYIVDRKVSDLYAFQLGFLKEGVNAIFIEATEQNKSIEMMPQVVKQLVEMKTRRSDTLIAIGGGIIQDISCFIASTFLRGLEWHFVPTTLLSQCDSCIGSKSSINSSAAKNILGTFNPPRKIYLDNHFLDTLGRDEILSGIGEMLKVHAIASKDKFLELAKEYDLMLSDRQVLMTYLWSSLEIKKRMVEIDEFDQNVRNVMNYGHSFGHAIEAATNFHVPHGIAVSMGCDLANYFAKVSGLGSKDFYDLGHETLKKNYMDFAKTNIPMNDFLSAISKDKKNTTQNLKLILPNHENEIAIFEIANDDHFKSICLTFFGSLKNDE